MRIGITGDTHGSIEAMEKIAKRKMKLDLWLHTGDFYSDADKLEEMVKTPVEAVLGNNDFANASVEYEKTFSHLGHKIFLTHGHKYTSSKLLYKAKEAEANIVVYGHTHIFEVLWFEDILFINPGSPAYPRGRSRSSFAVLELFENIMPEVRQYTL